MSVIGWTLWPWSDPNPPLWCMAQAFFAYNYRAQYMNSSSVQIAPTALAQCIDYKRHGADKCPCWWPGGSCQPVLPASSSTSLLNVRYYVFRDNAWKLVPFASGKTFVGARDSWASLLAPSSYKGKAWSPWADRHGKIARGALLHGSGNV